MKSLRRMMTLLVAALLVLLIGIGAGWWMFGSGWTKSSVRQVVVATLQQERAESFLVTGSVDVSATVERMDQKLLLPGILNLDLGTTEVTLRMPSTTSYGVDLTQIDSTQVLVRGDTIQIAMPDLSVHMVQPDLEQMQIQTKVGWARTRWRSGTEQQRKALAAIEPELRKVAAKHLGDSRQPYENTARAVRQMLAPVLRALGTKAVLDLRFESGLAIVIDDETLILAHPDDLQTLIEG